MTAPQPPKPSQTLLGRVTQLAQRAGVRVDFEKLKLQQKARVPELWVYLPGQSQPNIYPLPGDRYLLGRSSQQCDIVVSSPLVSQVHLSLNRDRRRRSPFVVRDEKSTNGIYKGKRRITRLPLYHQRRLTLGPPELVDAVQLHYHNPPPLWLLILRYGLVGVASLLILVILWILLEWQKFNVYPLPNSVQGPVVIYARDGQTLISPATIVAHRELKSLSEFSRYLPQAVIASEDTRFYWHLGIDPIGITRAVVTNVRGGEIREGASTITQQVARSLFRDYVGTEDSAGRKLREALVALKLEMVYNKDFLLLVYLNRVYLGNANYGFEDAAQFYFGKSARDLSLSEAATLAGILPAPNRINPVRDYESAIDYRDRILNRMAAMGMVSKEEADRARRSRIEVNPKAIEQLQSGLAPYFYGYIFQELEDLLGTQLADEGNFIVETQLDPTLQRQAEKVLRAAIATMGSRDNFSQGAIVTLDARTGAILAMVGGNDFRQSQFNRAVQALRQPGSTFKIFAYAAALEQGISPATTYSCAPLEWQGQAFAGCRGGGGNMDMYRAMALSENVVAIRITQDIGIEKLIQTATKFGVKSKLRPSPALVLGESETTLLEMTGAFAVLANGGIYNRPRAIQRILDSSDCSDRNNLQSCRIIDSWERDRHRNLAVVSPQVAETMTQMLQGVVQNGTGRDANVAPDVAGKTGTTNDNVDLWFIGYSPSRQLVTGVWLGNDDNQPTSGASADAAAIWGDYMAAVLR